MNKVVISDAPITGALQVHYQTRYEAQFPSHCPGPCRAWSWIREFLNRTPSCLRQCTVDPLKRSGVCFYPLPAKQMSLLASPCCSMANDVRMGGRIKLIYYFKVRRSCMTCPPGCEYIAYVGPYSRSAVSERRLMTLLTFTERSVDTISVSEWHQVLASRVRCAVLLTHPPSTAAFLYFSTYIIIGWLMV